MKTQTSIRGPNVRHSPDVTTALALIRLEWMPPRLMAVMLAALGLLAASASPVTAQQRADLVAKEGDIAHAADIARRLYFADPATAGAGVKVCVVADSIDDSHNSLNAARLSGAIPQNVDVLAGQAGTGTGEGLAMLEIIHKLAPGAPLGFATGNGGEMNMAANIRKLASEKNCKIIVDDKIYPGEPVFQDGVGEISKAINEVTAAGVHYFSAGGNWGSKKQGTSAVWEGDFNDGGASPVTTTGRVHKFPSGALFATVTTATSLVTLHWSDPWKTLRSQYQMVVRDKDDNNLGQLDAVTRAPPVQILDPSGDPNRPYLAVGDKIYIIKGSTSSDRYLHLNAYMGSLDVGTAGSTHAHATSEAAISVAAVQVPNPATAFTTSNIKVDPRSSDGGRRIFFKPDGTAITAANFLATGGRVLNKPDLAAATCVKTTLPGDALNNFCGTSAAAPHAAAIAALVLSKYPFMTPARVRHVLTRSALWDGTGHWNENTGAGVVMATTALAMAAAQWSPIVAYPGGTMVLKDDGSVTGWPGISNVIAIFGGGRRFALLADRKLIDDTGRIVNEKVINVSTEGAVAFRRNGTARFLASQGQWGWTHHKIFPNFSALQDVAGGTFDWLNEAVFLKRDGTLQSYSSHDGSFRSLSKQNVIALSFLAYSEATVLLLKDGSVDYLGGHGLQTNGVRDPIKYREDSTYVPKPSGVDNVLAIATGSTHVLALRKDGTVTAWGHNNEGQCNVPAGLTDVVGVAAYGFMSYALQSDGTVRSWGSPVI
jgi:hypothetical protein